MPKKTLSQLDTLRADRATLQARHAEITADRDAAAAALATAQGDLIDGKPDAADRVTTAQARANGADGALAMLADRLTTLDVKIQEAERSVEIDTILADLASSARAVNDGVDSDEALAGQLAEVFDSAVSEIYAVRQARNDAHRRFGSLLQQAEAHGVSQAEAIAAVQDAGAETGRATASHFASVPLGTYGLPLGNALAHALTDLSQRRANAARQAA